VKPDRAQVGRGALWLGLLAFAWVLLRTAWVCDDAFISFRVVENAVSGHGLRWNIAERVQVFTHPLWLLLHIPLRAITGEIYHTSLALSAGLSLAAVGLLAWRVCSVAWAGAVVLVLAVGSSAFVDYSTSGLENPLTHLLLVVFFLASLRSEPDSRTLLLQAGIAGLLTWNRLDTSLLAFPVLAVSVWRAGPRKAWRPVLAGLSPALGWFLFATVYYGHPFPNTAFAKLGAGTGSVELAGLAVRYASESLRNDPLTLLTVTVALLVAFARRRHLGIACGIALYLLYVVRVGGDFMSGRFFTAPFVLALALIGAELTRPGSKRILTALALTVILGLAAGSVPLTSGPDYGKGKERLIDAYGVADERAYYFRKSGWWNGAGTVLAHDDKWFEATTAQHCGFPLLIAGAIGFYGYTAGPDLHIVDYNALADPVLARLPAVENDLLYLDWYSKLEGKPPATERRIGHFLRNVPPGYTAYLLGDSSRFETAEMRRHVETVTLAVRGPLFSGERLKAVWSMATGETSRSFTGPGFSRFQSMPVAEIIETSPDGVYTATLQGCGLSEADPRAALPLLRSAIAGCPENGLAWKCLADASEVLGLHDQALEARRHVAAMAPWAEWAQADLQNTEKR